jgi:anti-anti-sigma factor
MVLEPPAPPLTAPWGSVTWSAAPHPLGIALRGEIDIALEEAFEVVQVFLAHSPRSDVAVCLHDVTFLDSTGLDFLLRVQTHVASTGASLCLVAPSPAVRWVLRVAGLDHMFEVAGPDSELAMTCECRAPRINGIVALVPLQRTGAEDRPGTVDGLAS